MYNRLIFVLLTMSCTFYNGFYKSVDVYKYNICNIQKVCANRLQRQQQEMEAFQQRNIASYKMHQMYAWWLIRSLLYIMGSKILLKRRKLSVVSELSNYSICCAYFIILPGIRRFEPAEDNVPKLSNIVSISIGH